MYPFRVRSLERDRGADLRRLNALLISVENALLSAEKELTGLAARVEEVRLRACLISDDEYFAGGSSRILPSILDQTEVALLAGEKRIADLKSQIDCFREFHARMVNLRSTLNR